MMIKYTRDKLLEQIVSQPGTVRAQKNNIQKSIVFWS
jgi:hypothetical protein